MKNIVFIFAKEALFGLLTPISLLTEANLQKAIGHLENETCDFVYIALDHFSEKNKREAEKYLSKYLKNLSNQKLESKIFVSASSKSYVEMFTEYVGQIPGEVCIDVMTRMDERANIEQSILIFLHKQESMPLVFTRCARTTF